MIPLLVASLIGGITGALLLLKRPAQTFMRVLPWLTLGATLLFAFGRKLARGRRSVIEQEASMAGLAGATLFQFGVAIYGGYFGGGMGIVMLAMLSTLGMTDIHSMNAMKGVMGSAINGVAVVTFVLAHAIYWKQGSVMILGGIAGGYLGAHYTMKIPQLWDPLLCRGRRLRNDHLFLLEVVLKNRGQGSEPRGPAVINAQSESNFRGLPAVRSFN